MAKPKLKITQVGLKKSLFHDLYYKVLKASWINFLLISGLIYIGLNSLFAAFYFFSPAEILNARPDSFWDAFIFSFQTSSTLGYGFLLPKTDIAHAIVIIDTMMGIFYVAIMTGLAFSKFARPSAKILFTDHMILSTFDGVPTLMFRLANNRNTHIIDASLNVAALMPYKSTEGHEMRRFYSLKLMSNNNPNFSLSWTAMHCIDESSPLYGLSLEDYKEKGIIVSISFTGIDDIISQTIHANHRYTSSQLSKAHKFTDILSINSDHNAYTLNFNKFHEFES